MEKTKTEAKTESQPEKRLRRECPHCHATRFERLSYGHYDELSGEFVIDEVVLRCLNNHHVIHERELNVVEIVV